MDTKKIIYIALAVGIVFKLGIFNGPPEFTKSYGDIVVLYGTSWCGYCEKTRELLDSRDIDYIEYDVEESARGRSEFDELGGTGYPLVLISGEVIKGFDRTKILRLARKS